MVRRLIVLFLFATLVNAQEFKGDWEYSIRNNELDLIGGRINNKNRSGRTGTLKLALYLTRFKYNGYGSISGYVIWDKTYDPLRANYYYGDIRILHEPIDSEYNSIPTGYYYVTLCLLEYQNFGYAIVDYVNFNGQLSKYKI